MKIRAFQQLFHRTIIFHGIKADSRAKHHLKTKSKQKEKQGKNPVSRLLYAIFKVVKYTLREKEKTKTELSSILISLGGEGEIRTLEPCYGLHDFQSCALDQLGDFSICCTSISHLF